MSNNYFPWIADEDAPDTAIPEGVSRTQRRKVEFENGQKGEDMLSPDGKTVTRTINSPYGLATSTIAVEKAGASNMGIAVGSPVAAKAPAYAAPSAPPVVGKEAPVSPVVAKQPEQPEQPDLSVSPVEYNQDTGKMQPYIASRDLDSLPIPDQFSAKTGEKFRKIRDTKGPQAANKFAAGHMDARPMPAWLNADPHGTVGGIEPGVDKLWDTASEDPSTKERVLRFGSGIGKGRKTFEIRGSSPADLATQYRRHTKSLDKTDAAAQRKFTSLLFS